MNLYNLIHKNLIYDFVIYYIHHLKVLISLVSGYKNRIQWNIFCTVHTTLSDKISADKDSKNFPCYRKFCPLNVKRSNYIQRINIKSFVCRKFCPLKLKL